MRIYDIDPGAVAKLSQKCSELGAAYRKDLKADDAAIAAAVGRLRAGSDLAEAVQGADLVIEAVPESVAVKRRLYEALSVVAPRTTIFAANSSTLLPSVLAQFTDRPERFLALHFASRVWRNNIAEVMRHSGTDDTTFDSVIAFAERIGMVPIALHKEQPGYACALRCRAKSRRPMPNTRDAGVLPKSKPGVAGERRFAPDRRSRRFVRTIETGYLL